MKVTLTELREFVEGALQEKRKKKKEKVVSGEALGKMPIHMDKDPDKMPSTQPAGFMRSEVHDFSRPLGALNPYAIQGSSNMGPWTATPWTGDTTMDVSAWDPLKESVEPRPQLDISEGSPWKAATRLHEKHIGFKSLRNRLARKRGVKDPGALAASIGRKKYGQKGMTAKSVAGRR